jgi:hypothetical protein
MAHPTYIKVKFINGLLPAPAPAPALAGSITPIVKSTSSFPLISKEENMAEIASCNHTSLSLSLYPSVF